MKWWIRILGGLFGVVLLWQASQMIASETGEVVVVTTRAADGSTRDTRLWVVDYDGSAWLRAGGDTSGWYRQMLAEPEIELERERHAGALHRAARCHATSPGQYANAR